MHHSFAAIVTQSEAQPERPTLPVWRYRDGGDDLILDQLVTIDDAPQLRGDRHTVRGAARADYPLPVEVPRRRRRSMLDQLVTIDDAPQLRGDRHTVRGAARADYSPSVERERRRRRLHAWHQLVTIDDAPQLRGDRHSQRRSQSGLLSQCGDRAMAATIDA